MINELRKAIDEENAKDFVPARNSALGKALAERMEVQVPDTLITNQAREKFAVMMAEMRDNGVSDDLIKQQINPENFSKYKEIVKDDIIRDFKTSIAADEIARLEGLSVPDYQVEEQMEAIRKDTDRSEDFDEKMIRMKVETTLLRQAVMDWLAQQSTLEVTYEDDTFDEALLDKLAEESLKREEELALKAIKSEMATGKPDMLKTTEVEPLKETDIKKVDEANMSLQDIAFNALLNAGAIQINKSPNDPDYTGSEDDLEASESIRKNS